MEFLIALGQSLYFDEGYSLDDRFSAAAELFEVALARADLLERRAATCCSSGGPARSIARRSRPRVGRDTRSTSASCVAPKRELARDDGRRRPATGWPRRRAASNDLTRAWGAAVAGWVRAGASARAAKRCAPISIGLMRQVILPERARELTPRAMPRPTLALLESQWQDLKAKWEGPDAPGRAGSPSIP